jgi:hypothetical protein
MNVHVLIDFVERDGTTVHYALPWTGETGAVVATEAPERGDVAPGYVLMPGYVAWVVPEQTGSAVRAIVR